MSSTVIKVDSISKRYRLGLKEKKADTFAGSVASMIKSPWDNFKRLRNLSKFGDDDESVFWALKDVSFEVKEGEVLGIIGKNGAGKSTLLKILSQITEPTSGQIEINGRVASLLEVGTGFHPELTGRDNIYMNGTILGMTRKEIAKKLDEIIDFSGVEKFIDTAVKFYSSGMKVRLGFSVAAHLEPEILIIDEVLAVGDYEFQRKCLGKMEDVAGHGRTVLFVSHNLSAVTKLCSRGILLSEGRVVVNNAISNVVNRYLEINSGTGGKYISTYEKDTHIKEAILFKEGSELSKSVFSLNDQIKLRIKVNSKQRLSKANLGIALLDKLGNKIFTDVYNIPQFLNQESVFVVDLPVNLIMPGYYSFDIAVFNGTIQVYDYITNVCAFQFEDTGYELSEFSMRDNIGVIRVKCKWEQDEV